MKKIIALQTKEFYETPEAIQALKDFVLWPQSKTEEYDVNFDPYVYAKKEQEMADMGQESSSSDEFNKTTNSFSEIAGSKNGILRSGNNFYIQDPEEFKKTFGHYPKWFLESCNVD